MGKRARAMLPLLAVAMVLLGGSFAPAFAVGNPPSVECGTADPLYNKFQWNDGFGDPEFSTPPGLIITVTDNGDGTFDYELTDDDYVITLIVLKIGEGGGAIPPPPLVDPPSSGTLDIPDKLSHIIFCFANAPVEPPTPPVVTASIVCSADAETGEGTYTLVVDAPEGVTTEPADGTVVDNADTTVTVTWDGGIFEITAPATEDCSFTPEEPPVEPPTPPVVTASIVCSADAETGEGTYTLVVDAPDGVTTEPADGTVVANADTTVTVTWDGGTFDVTAPATEDCSFTPEQPPVVEPPVVEPPVVEPPAEGGTTETEADTQVLGEQVERELAKTGAQETAGFGLAGLAFLASGVALVTASRRPRLLPQVSMCQTSRLVVFQALRLLPVRRRG